MADDTPVARLVLYCSATNSSSYEWRQFRVLVMEYFDSPDSMESDEVSRDLMMQCMNCESLHLYFLLISYYSLSGLHILYNLRDRTSSQGYQHSHSSGPKGRRESIHDQHS